MLSMSRLKDWGNLRAPLFCGFSLLLAIGFTSAEAATAKSIGTCSTLFTKTAIESPAVMESPESPAAALIRASSYGEADASEVRRKFLKKIAKLNPDKTYSEADIRRFVVDLFVMKYGSPHGSKYLKLDDENYAQAKLLRALQEEVGARGVIEFYRSRGLLVDRSRLTTVARELWESSLLQHTLAASSLFSLLGHRPFVYLPYDDIYKITPQQFETLFLYGRQSPEGQAQIAEISLMARHQKSDDLNVRLFNRMSFVVSLALISMFVVQEEDAKAKANGDQVLASIAEANAKIEARGRQETKEDIHFDVVRQRLAGKLGRNLSPREHQLLCAKIPAPGRCH